MHKNNVSKSIKKVKGNGAINLEAILASDRVRYLATSTLIVVGVTGMVGLSLVAPKMLRVLAPFLYGRGRKPLRNSEQRTKLAKVFYYLKESGQIKIEDRGEGLFAYLTKKGLLRFNKITTDIYVIPKPRNWSGTWWLVAADIPTRSYRACADMLRTKLRELHFYHLQRTLWLYPHDPRNVLEYVVNKYGIGKFVTLMEVVRVDKQDEKQMRIFFKKCKIL